MIKLKEIEKQFDKLKIEYHRSENNQYLCVYCCSIGNNFYDYGENQPKEWDYSNFPKDLINDPRIVIIPCEECYGCAGW